MIVSGCVHDADNCVNTRTCEPPSDAGPSVIYVVTDAGCNGVCVPLPGDSAGFSPQPFLLWSGQVTDLPPPSKQCPMNAPTPSQDWHSTPDQTPLSCPVCSCAPSMGACMLPETVSVTALPACPSDAADAGVPFDPPSAWDGGCTTNDPIAAVKCDGGPCLTAVGPMIPVDECVPNQVTVPKIVIWGVAAYSCSGHTNDGACAGAGEVCTPAPPMPALGFNICVSRPGDDQNVMCPAGYPVRSVFYLSGDDNRSCAPCGCEPPQGSTCSSLVSLYSDNACSMQVGSVTATSSSVMCVDVPANSPLGSKQASVPTYTPGSCKPIGGGYTGSVQPTDPFTFCCQK